MEERKSVRAKAVLECFEQIPCNPCVKSCPQGAIFMEGGIHFTPKLMEEKCVGCGICITRCSGQAIFVVEANEEKGYVSIPYEFLPLPEKGMCIDATDRDGKYVCDGIIADVRTAPAFDHTNIVKIQIPAQYIGDVRSFRFKKEDLS